MLDRVKAFIQDKHINRLREQFKTPDDEMFDFKYDQEKEKRWFAVNFQEKGEYVTKEFEGTFENKLADEFLIIAKKDFKELKTNLQSIANDKVLNREEEKVTSSLTDIAMLLQESDEASKYPYLIGILKNMVKEIQQITSINIELFNEKEEEARGNPVWKQRRTISDQQLNYMILRANKLIKEAPNTYLPSRRDAYMSNNLANELERIFEKPANTIKDNFKKRAIKKGQLFVAKINYS